MRLLVCAGREPVLFPERMSQSVTNLSSPPAATTCSCAAANERERKKNERERREVPWHVAIRAMRRLSRLRARSLATHQAESWSMVKASHTSRCLRSRMLGQRHPPKPMPCTGSVSRL